MLLYYTINVAYSVKFKQAVHTERVPPTQNDLESVAWYTGEREVREWMDCAIVSCFSNTHQDILFEGFQNRIEGFCYYGNNNPLYPLVTMQIGCISELKWVWCTLSELWPPKVQDFTIHHKSKVFFHWRHLYWKKNPVTSKDITFKRYSRSVGWPSVQWDVVTIAMETCNSILARYGLFSEYAPRILAKTIVVFNETWTVYI